MRTIITGDERLTIEGVVTFRLQSLYFCEINYGQMELTRVDGNKKYIQVQDIYDEYGGSEKYKDQINNYLDSCKSIDIKIHTIEKDIIKQPKLTDIIRLSKTIKKGNNIIHDITNSVIYIVECDLLGRIHTCPIKKDDEYYEYILKLNLPFRDAMQDDFIEGGACSTIIDYIIPNSKELIDRKDYDGGMVSYGIKHKI